MWLGGEVVFVKRQCGPGGAIQKMLGEGAARTDIQAARHAYGLDVPLGRQYVNYWKGVLRLDLGCAIRFDQPVARVIAKRYPATLQLTPAPMSVALLLSLPTAVPSSRLPDRAGHAVL